jgi:hypothetical protein
MSKMFPQIGHWPLEPLTDSGRFRVFKHRGHVTFSATSFLRARTEGELSLDARSSWD